MPQRAYLAWVRNKSRCKFLLFPRKHLDFLAMLLCNDCGFFMQTVSQTGRKKKPNGLCNFINRTSYVKITKLLPVKSMNAASSCRAGLLNECKIHLVEQFLRFSQELLLKKIQCEALNLLPLDPSPNKSTLLLCWEWLSWRHIGTLPSTTNHF